MMKIEEQLLRKLIKSIEAYSYTRFEDDSNGPYREHCPFCDSYTTYRGNQPTPSMDDISHETDCPYEVLQQYRFPEEYI